MTREQVQAHKQTLQQQMQQAQANVYAFQGAIQDCDHWLQQFVEEEKREKQGNGQTPTYDPPLTARKPFLEVS